MGGQRRPLLRRELAHAHAVGDRGPGRTSGADDLRVVPDHQPERAQRAEERGYELARNRRLQGTDAGKFGRTGACWCTFT